MPREKLPERARRVRIDLTLAPSVAEVLKQQAKRLETTRSALVERLIETYVDELTIKAGARRAAAR
jgi:hypothetical protein